MSILPLLILLPLVGAIILCFLPEDDADDIRGAAMVASAVTFLVSLVLYQRFDVSLAPKAINPLDPASPILATMQFQWVVDWARGAKISLGIDGLSLWLILLTTFLMPLTILGSWRSVATRVKEFHIALLVLESTMIAVFCAQDVLLFYVFWEAMLIPMFLLIGVYGSENRIAATMKFFIYTAAGSLMMLAAIIYVHRDAGSFAMTDMVTAARRMSAVEQWWLAAAFGLAFAIKVPLFPLHTWLPHAHVQAPAAGSVTLAAVMLKMGGYGFLRFGVLMFPLGMQQLAPTLAGLAAVGVVYGACMALAQSDLKRLIAYSSVSHLALVVLGIVAANTASITGAVYQMLAHGLSTGGLFLLVGMLYERKHSRELSAYGGLAAVAPWLTAMFLVTTLASIAVPGTAGFIGEFMILMGAFQVMPGWTALGACGVVLGAGYMLWLVRRVFWGPLGPENKDFPDLDSREWCVLLPVVAAMLLMGLIPGPVLAGLENAVRPMVAAMRAAGG